VERAGGYKREEWKIEIPAREKVKSKGGFTTPSTSTSVTKSFN
jgi:hypothetical protein